MYNLKLIFDVHVCYCREIINWVIIKSYINYLDAVILANQYLMCNTLSSKHAHQKVAKWTIGNVRFTPECSRTKLTKITLRNLFTVEVINKMLETKAWWTIDPGHLGRVKHFVAKFVVHGWHFKDGGKAFHHLLSRTLVDVCFWTSTVVALSHVHDVVFYVETSFI